MEMCEGERMKLTDEQKRAIYTQLSKYRISLVNSVDSSWDEIQLYSDADFFNLLDDALENVTPDYEKGFEILNEYFDFIPECERENVGERLVKVGL